MPSAFGSISRIAALALAATLATPTLARAETPVALTLPEALDFARAHEPQIRGALAELSARQSEAKIPRAGWYPTLGAAAELLVGTTNNTTASYLGVPEVDLPRIGATKATTSTAWGPSGSTLAALTVDQEVYDFGRIAARSAVADALAEEARAGAEEVGLEIQLGVEETYHGVLAAKEVLKATGDAYKRAVAHRDYAKAGTKSGMRPPIDLTRAQADVAQLSVRMVQAQAGLASAQAALAASIGSDRLAIDAVEIPAAQAEAPAFDEVLRLAATRNPEIAQATAKVDASKSLASELTRELYPNLFATGTLSGRAGGGLPSGGAAVPYGDGFLPDVGNWDLGLVFQWNLLDATVLARRRAAKEREAVATADLATVRQSVRLDAQRAWLDLDAAKKALPALEETVKAAQANQAQADARFRAGLGTVVELADAEALLTNAELEMAIGRFAVARARARLGRMIGEQLFSVAPAKGKVR